MPRTLKLSCGHVDGRQRLHAANRMAGQWSKSAADLDADMDSYFAKKGAAAEE